MALLIDKQLQFYSMKIFTLTVLNENSKSFCFGTPARCDNGSLCLCSVLVVVGCVSFQHSCLVHTLVLHVVSCRVVWICASPHSMASARKRDRYCRQPAPYTMFIFLPTSETQSEIRSGIRNAVFRSSLTALLQCHRES